MPASQLKKLKASLHTEGVLGPQKSKKKQRQSRKNGGTANNRLRKEAALESIRQQFNPFEVKPVKQVKHSYANGLPNAPRDVVARPGITKGLGEEKVREWKSPNFMRKLTPS